MALFKLALIWALSITIYCLLIRRYGDRLWAFIVLTATLLTPAFGYYKVIAPPFAIYPLWIVLPETANDLFHPSGAGIFVILFFILPAAITVVMIATLVRRWLTGSWI
ncbi:MAG: hypothetical protein ACKOZX_09340 [Gammaproteobacteria bacterium]